MSFYSFIHSLPPTFFLSAQRFNRSNGNVSLYFFLLEVSIWTYFYSSICHFNLLHFFVPSDLVGFFYLSCQRKKLCSIGKQSNDLYYLSTPMSNCTADTAHYRIYLFITNICYTYSSIFWRYHLYHIFSSVFILFMELWQNSYILCRTLTMVHDYLHRYCNK